MCEIIKHNITIFGVVLLSAANINYAQTCNENMAKSTPDSHFELVAENGNSEVLDKQTHLIWQRCSIGQSWDGITCMGTPNSYTWTEALAQAKQLGNSYRLPNIKELQSLVEEIGRASCMERV